jgi:GNAT superfamily N-acetyltransferase
MPSEHITIRRASPEDALCLGVLGTQVFLDTYANSGIRASLAKEVLRIFSTEEVSALLQRDDTCVLLAECNGHLIGFAQTRLGVAEPCVAGIHPAELERLYLQEPFTGIGLGTRLLAATEKHAAGAGADILWLSYLATNTRADRFYARHQYSRCGTLMFEMEGEQHENIVVQKPVR